MNAAHELLDSMRDFGWPIFAYAIFAPIPTYVLPSDRSREEKTERLLFVGAILAAMEVIFFLGTESNNVWQVASLNPAWGVFVSFLLLVAVGTGAIQLVLTARRNRAPISIGEQATSNAPIGRYHRVFSIMGPGAWIVCMILAVLWLIRIANTQ